jgi:glucan phosphoethanolaminetransferase (alkaline phosphatase superfamily)
MDYQLVLGFLIMLIFAFTIKGYIKRQRSAIKEMEGLWRILACVPLIAVAAAIVVSIIGLIQESNLWPIFLIFILPVAYVYLLILWAVYRAIQRSRSAPGSSFNG